MKHKTCVRTVPLLFFMLCLLPAWGHAQTEDRQEQLLAVFHPYRQGPPRVEGIAPGMKIDTSNFQVAHEVLPPDILKYVQAGDFALSVQETTDMPLRQAYIQATLDHSAQVELGEGELANYVAGRPFPLLDAQDAQAGEKAIWNQRYRDQGDTRQYWPTDELRNSSGGVERTRQMYVAFQWGMHRPGPAQNLPQWEKEGILFRMYARTLAPADVEGSQLLIYLHDKDTNPNEQWVYDPGSRRTRKVVDNPYDAPGGGPRLIEDIDGFSGYIHTYEWQYLGEQVVLAPGPIRATEPTLGGRGQWYPQDPWELRTAVVVEAQPKASHPLYSRRLLYIDRQTDVVLYTLTYDRAGNHKRTFFMVYFHPEFNPWNHEVWIPQPAAQASIDYQQERASIFQTHKVVYNTPLKGKMFQLKSLMRYGK